MLDTLNHAKMITTYLMLFLPNCVCELAQFFYANYYTFDKNNSNIVTKTTL